MCSWAAAARSATSTVSRRSTAPGSPVAPADSCASSFCATAGPGWACSSSIAPGMRRRSSGYGSTEQGETALDRVRTRGGAHAGDPYRARSEEHTSELQSQSNLVCRLLLEKKKKDQPAKVTAQRVSRP